MISPFIISLKEGMFLDLRADNVVQIFEELPFDNRYSNDTTLIASEQNRKEVIDLKNMFISKLLVNDKDLENMTENVRAVMENGTDCVLRCIVFCEYEPFLETMKRIQQVIYKINDIRGRNYGGLIFFVVSKYILSHLDTISQINSEIEKDWEYNHVAPALLVTSKEEAYRSPDVLHWLRFQNCADLIKEIPFYDNMDTIIDLTDILKRGSIAEISETLYKIRLSEGYSRARLYPFALHKLLFEPNSIQSCSCLSKAFSSYVDGCLHNGCFVSCKFQYNLRCNSCEIAHLCGGCGHAFRNDNCIFRELTEKYYSLITQLDIKLC